MRKARGADGRCADAAAVAVGVCSPPSRCCCCPADSEVRQQRRAALLVVVAVVTVGLLLETHELGVLLLLQAGG